MSNEVKYGRGAPSITDPRNKTKLVEALKGIKGIEGYAEPSYHIKRQLAEAGYMKFVKGAPNGGRGRPANIAQLMPKGHAVVNFSK